MCARYDPLLNRDRFIEAFHVRPPDAVLPLDVRPGGRSAFIRLHNGQREALAGTFGLMPHWAKPNLFRQTYNARTETVAEKPSFRSAWRRAQHCIIPAEAIWEPDWRSGKHIPTRIARSDTKAIGIAGLWEERTNDQTGEIQHSFTMLTINADGHAIMGGMHKVDDEKRMVIILPEDRYASWLDASTVESPDFFKQYPATLLTSTAG